MSTDSEQVAGTIGPEMTLAEEVPSVRQERWRDPVWRSYQGAVPPETLLTQHAEYVRARAPKLRYSAQILFHLQEHLQRLRLFKSRDRLEALLQEATGKELSYADFLDQVLTEEVASKKHVTMRTQLTRFRFVKSLDAFDSSYQPSLDKKQIQTLSTCHFIEHGENLVILGPPGVGKPRVAVGLDLKVIDHGYRVLFTTAAALITSLTRALTEGRLDDRLNVYTVPRLGATSAAP